MHTRNRLVSALFLLALAVPSTAQDLQLSFKLGPGRFVGDPGESRSRYDLLMGAELAMPFRTGKVFLGADYRVFRNMSYDGTRFGQGYALDSLGQVVTGQITRYVLGPDGLPKADGRYDSVDIRRNNLESLTLNLGYRVPFWQEGLSAHGGIHLSLLRSQQDVSGGINVVVNRNVTTPTVLGSENFFIQPVKNSITPGAFAGLRYDATRVFFLEANLSLLGFKEVNYLPFSYTGQAATTEMRNLTKVLLEFSAGFNF